MLTATETLPDEEYPRAVVRRLPEPRWSDADAAQLAEADRAVRRALAKASEHPGAAWGDTASELLARLLAHVGEAESTWS